MTFLAHKCCWKLANSQGITPALDWLRMAVQTRPFEFRSSYLAYEPFFNMRADLWAVEGRFLNRDTDLGNLAFRLSMMPLEIQCQVLDGLKFTLFISLLKTKNFTQQILPRIRPSNTLQPTINTLSTDAGIRSLQVRSTNILGRSYLAEISVNDHIDHASSSTTVANDSVRGLRFALGKFGLRGIQIIYDDGHSSSWLGESSMCWIGVIHGRDISKLRITADVSVLVTRTVDL